MVWLCLDTHIPGQTRLGLLGESGWIEYTETEGRAPRVLTTIAAYHRNKEQSIKGVCVVEGPGSFSAIRIGVLYANLYARLEHLPLVPVGPQQFQDPVALFRDLEQQRFQAVPYVAPVYDQEPNITIPKS